MIPGVGGLHGRQKRALVGRLGKTVMNQRIVCPTETAAAFKTDRYALHHEHRRRKRGRHDPAAEQTVQFPEKGRPRGKGDDMDQFVNKKTLQ